VENFVRLEVRVSIDLEERATLLFPVRYPYFDEVVGIKKVYVDPLNGEICEENLPSEKTLLDHQVFEGTSFKLYKILIKIHLPIF